MQPSMPPPEPVAGQEAAGARTEDQPDFPQVLGLHQKLLNAVPSLIMILDSDRRIVACNQALVDYVGAGSGEELLGLRPGEAVACIYALESPGVCGTTGHCCVCGANNAIQAAQIGGAAAGVCRLRRRTEQGEQALDLQIWTTPLEAGDQRFTIWSAQDIRDTLVRQALERVLEEAVQLAGIVCVLSDRIEEGAAGAAPEPLQKSLASAARQLRGLLVTQGELAAAERGELAIGYCPVSSLALLGDLLKQSQSREAARNRTLRLDPSAQDVTFRSDPVLVRSVLARMLENALEASQPGETVSVGCRRSGDSVELWMHNPGCMPRDVRLQVFQGFFTTKGPGRGVGTYVMKLLSQRYLGGDVSFTTSEGEGTVFVARYPVEREQPCNH